MKFNFSIIEVENILAGINERIASYEELNSKIVSEKEYIDRLLELKSKIVLGEVILLKDREISLFTGIINGEVWNKLKESYHKVHSYSSLKYFYLSNAEKVEIETIDRITELSNRLNKSNKYEQKDLFVQNLKFHERLKSNINGKWYYSHNKGNLYRTAIQLNDKEYLEIKINERNLIAEMKIFPLNMSYLSSFMNIGTKNDVLELIQEYKKNNELDITQDFIVKMIKACE